MTWIDEIVVAPTTDQQIRMTRGEMAGPASYFLAAVGATVLRDVQFDDDSLNAITEARLRR